MKIEYIKGDLFTTDCKVIVHGCNAQGVMGSGVAKIIRDKYPKAYNEYRTEYERNVYSLPIGNIIPVWTNSKMIINAITQDYYGQDGKRYVSYDAVAKSMHEVNKFCLGYNYKEVAMPQIGAGLGGGDWNVIAAIIESELKDVQVKVYIL